MAEQFDELFAFTSEQVAEIEKREAERLTEVPDVEVQYAARKAKWDALRAKYPLPAEGFYSVENVGLIAYAELAINAYGFNPIENPGYRPSLDPLPENQPAVQMLGRGENTLPNNINL